MNHPTTILYHANCTDGAGAALAAWTVFGEEAKYIPVQYGDNPPDGLEGHDIYILDFSYPRDTLRALSETAHSITILDHHKTAMADLAGLSAEPLPCPVRVTFDMEQSGAALAWRHFHPGTELPSLIAHIQDRDLWRFELPATRDIIAGLQLYSDWRMWASFLTDDHELGLLRDDGSAINTYLERQAKRIIATEPQYWHHTGDTVPVYNLPGFMISDTLHMALGRYLQAPYAVAWFETADKRVYSLRSRSGTDVDVSEIAERFGGGGHKHAAGFTVPASWQA